MKELFCGAMVRAILDGRKTQTRRVAKPVKHPDLGNIYAPGAFVLENEPKHAIERACPYGQPGNRLWVRETWAQPVPLDPGPTVYRADYPACVPPGYENIPTADEITWKPSIHMPRSACRLLLEITGVRAERLQDCSEADAIAEGIKGRPSADGEWAHYADTGLSTDAIGSYRSLWELINGPASWAANPWVGGGGIQERSDMLGIRLSVPSVDLGLDELLSRGRSGVDVRISVSQPDDLHWRQRLPVCVCLSVPYESAGRLPFAFSSRRVGHFRLDLLHANLYGVAAIHGVLTIGHCALPSGRRKS